MREIIPGSAVALLPFSSQSYVAWDGRDDLDLIYFLFELYDKTDEVLLPDGTRGEMNYRFYAAQIFEMGTRTIAAEAKVFAEQANCGQPARGSATQDIYIPNFLEDARFGRVAKYHIAWGGMFQEILAESAFFSLAHLQEANTDLMCCMRLAAGLYYKQALQVLRSYVENIILPLYLCADISAFNRWKRNKFRVPRMRGENGILSGLVDQYILTEDLANEAAELYDSLNEAVHGSERNMIHSGTSRGEWSGQIFDDGKFGQWCSCFCHAVDLGIRITKINLLQWTLAKPKGKLDCLICHNDNNFASLEVVEDRGVSLIRYRCGECGNEFMLREGEPNSREVLSVQSDGTKTIILRPD
jgi:hypothetical protein